MPSVLGGLKMTLANLSQASLKGYTRKGTLKDSKFQKFFISSFWIMFDPGNPEYLGPEGGHSENRRLFGVVLWATFQVSLFLS